MPVLLIAEDDEDIALVLTRVFIDFYRGSNVRHQGTTGSGLGLSLARAIVLLHGGTIRLEENRPTGTVVDVRLPLAGPPTT